MGLIKANAAPTKVSAFSMADVERHAANIVQRAKAQAEQLLAEAQAEGERIRRERYEQGFQEGREAGVRQGVEQGMQAGHDAALQQHAVQLLELMQGLAGAARQLEESRRKLEQETVYDVIRLSVAIARRVTKAMGRFEPEVVRANVAEALRMVVGASAVKVALHPDQLSIMEEELPNLRAMFPKLEQVELVADGSLSPGGCRLIAGSGIVDADLDGQLDRVVADLLPPGTEAPR